MQLLLSLPFGIICELIQLFLKAISIKLGIAYSQTNDLSSSEIGKLFFLFSFLSSVYQNTSQNPVPDVELHERQNPHSQIVNAIRKRDRALDRNQMCLFQLISPASRLMSEQLGSTKAETKSVGLTSQSLAQLEVVQSYWNRKPYNINKKRLAVG